MLSEQQTVEKIGLRRLRDDSIRVFLSVAHGSVEHGVQLHVWHRRRSMEMFGVRCFFCNSKNEKSKAKSEMERKMQRGQRRRRMV